MSETSSKLVEALELLQNSKAPKRESGAKRLRKLGIAESGEALLQALQKEVQDKRTWSTQYQLIIALGVIKYNVALPFLWKLANQNLDATILYLALGDSIVRLSLERKSIAKIWREALDTQNPMLLMGALRAIALLKLIPDNATIRSIVEVARRPEFIDCVPGYPGDQSGLRYWIAVASAGWEPRLVHDFLLECQLINDASLRYAVENALKSKYVKWNY